MTTLSPDEYEDFVDQDGQPKPPKKKKHKAKKKNKDKDGKYIPVKEIEMTVTWTLEMPGFGKEEKVISDQGRRLLDLLVTIFGPGVRLYLDGKEWTERGLG